MRVFILPTSEQLRTLEINSPKSTDHKLGGIALLGFERDQLGINDPMAHVDQYLLGGEKALGFIEDEVIYDCVERMDKPTFINPINWRFTGTDFVTKKCQTSMDSMTSRTKEKFSRRVVDINEYKRAKIETLEPSRLVSWFRRAESGDRFVVESLPVSESEEYAVVRIYKKQGEEDLKLSAITLHNPSVEVFNLLRGKIGVLASQAEDNIDHLDDMYTVASGGSDFEQDYIDTYDTALSELSPTQQFRFGLDKQTHSEVDYMKLVKDQEALRSIYTTSLKAIAGSSGRVSKDLIIISEVLNLDFRKSLGERLTINDARNLMDASLQSIMAVLNRTPLNNAATISLKEAYKLAGHHGQEARAADIRYNGSCPTNLFDEQQEEQGNLNKAYRLEGDPTKCQTCPGCKEVVDLPENLYYKKKIMHCVKCKLNYEIKTGKSYYKDLLKSKRAPSTTLSIVGIVKPKPQVIDLPAKSKQSKKPSLKLVT